MPSTRLRPSSGLPQAGIAWRHASTLVRMMDATYLLAILGGRTSARETAIASVAVRGPIEVALAVDGSDAGLRRAWRERHKGRATPLLVLHDVGARGLVRVLGPTDERAPIREVPADRLSDVLQRTSSLSRLLAAREVGEELRRLDAGGIPGVVVKDLLTRHLVQVRLPLMEQWAGLEKSVNGLSSATDWKSLLTGLGFSLERRTNRRGWLARAEGAPLLVVHPLENTAAFARLDDSGRPPEGTLALDCHAEGVRYGALASGSRLRLFRAGAEAERGGAAATTSYLELDAADLRAEHRPLLGLLAPDALKSDGLFDHLVAEGTRFGAELRNRLDEDIRGRVLPELARGLGNWAIGTGRDLADPAVRRDIENASLTWVFRALFVLYAESAGYLPIDHVGYQSTALTTLAEQAAANLDSLDPKSTTLWDRFSVLVHALRTGDSAIGVPAYNGALFSADSLSGAAVLEAASVTNDVFGRALAALGRDSATGLGVDYSSLEIGHLGHVYEGLLSLHVAVADTDLALYPTGEKKALRYEVAKKSEDVVVASGELFWQTHTGGRKAGGVYYTPDLLVEHLVRRTVLPSLEVHLELVRDLAATDPAAAAVELFRFRVLDPACGSAHFLVSALHRTAERIDRFLAETPLPGVRDELEALRGAAATTHGARIEHADLLHRLVLKRCIYGVDVSPMGAEVARLSLWLAAFVPGLSLAYLGHTVQVGDALVGVADPSVLQGESPLGMRPLYADQVDDAIAAGAKAAMELGAVTDRTPDDVGRSMAADLRLRLAGEGIRQLFDAWTAGPLGVPAARVLVATDPLSVIDGSLAVPDDARRVTEELRVLHWPLAYPEVFTGERPGFDVIVGNPPWEEVTVEELAFYARYSPRLRGLSAGPRTEALAALQAARPELADEFRREQDRVALLKRFLGPAGGYVRTAGDPDLYKYFCMRYRVLLRSGGRIGVVLPRSAFMAAGSRGFREWLFDTNCVERIDFLLNNRLWMFDTHGQYTVALLVAGAWTPAGDHLTDVAGVADSATTFATQSSTAGVPTPRSAMGSAAEVPLVPSIEAAHLLSTMRRHQPFAHGGGRWRCFPTREFDETDDKKLWEGATEGWALWKGESIDQHDPHGRESRWCPPTEAAMKKALKPRPGMDSPLAKTVALSQRKIALHSEVGKIRLGFRDVTNRTNSRSVLASLIPAETFLLNSIRYLVFVEGGYRERAACCAIMNSLPFDWQARRFIETHVSYFILELLTVPAFSDAAYEELVSLGALLSCPDERFAEVAESCGIVPRTLPDDERIALRARVDAVVAHAFGLIPADLQILFDDFTIDAVPQHHRDLMLAELEQLCR